MAFDVQAALDAGFTPEDIADYLQRHGIFDSKEMREKGATDTKVLDSYLASVAPKPRDLNPLTPRKAYADEGQPAAQRDYNLQLETPEEGVDYDALDQSVADYVSDTISNVPGSAVNLAKGLGHVVMHPVETAKNMGDLVVGAKEMGVRALDPYAVNEPSIEEQKAQAVADTFKGRYGTLGDAANTFRDDPLGAALDASMVLGGGGALLRGAAAASKAAGAAKVGSVIGNAGQIVTKAGQAIDPLTTLSYAMKPLAPVANAAAKKIGDIASPEAIYGRAMKMPPRTIKDTNRDMAITAALNERIPISGEGLAKAKQLTRDIEKDVQKALVDPKYENVRIDPVAVAMGAEDRVMNTIGTQVSRTGDINAMQKVTDDFLGTYDHPLTLKEAHDIKQGTQHAQSKRAYDERKSAAVETEKEYTRELNDRIYGIAPEIKTMNRRIQGLTELAKEMPNTLNRVGNHSLVNLAGVQGLGTYLGHYLGGPAGAMLGWGISKAASSPRIQSEIAIAMNAMRNGYKVSAPVRKWMKRAGIPAKYGALIEARYGGILGEIERQSRRNRND